MLAIKVLKIVITVLNVLIAYALLTKVLFGVYDPDNVGEDLYNRAALVLMVFEILAIWL
jgi:hypothetical protein